MDKLRTLLSVGIDIGTTTTQILFTRLTMETSGGFGCVPKTEITGKEIVYRSPIYFTPLKDDRIDSGGTAEIIRAEYAAAGFSPHNIDTGAVIITGESARRRNAPSVISAAAQLCGDFVAAAAGPDLESYLAGKGSGCCELSKKYEYIGKNICNLDIGGGTSNLGVFRGGKDVSAACLDIGGRLIRISGGFVEYIAPKLSVLLKKHDIGLRPGDSLSDGTAVKICGLLTRILEAACGLREPDGDLALMLCTKELSAVPDFFTFSGGVADCISSEPADFRYGDIGVYLGRALRRSRFFESGKVIASAETMRATVIGAGSYTLNLSGSTIFKNNIAFPIKSLPAAYVSLETPDDFDNFALSCRDSLRKTRSLYSKNAALAFGGFRSPTFAQCEQIAEAIAGNAYVKGEELVVLIREDWAKALGQALLRRLGKNAKLLCADGLNVSAGDFVDIGAPVGGANAIPVIIKTLVFG